MIADAIQCFDAQIEWNQRDVGAPKRVIEAMRDKWRECVFAGVPTGAMPAIVPKCNGFSKHGVKPECARYSNGYLCNFKSVGESSALMILREDKYLSLSSESAESGSMQDAIAVAFETGAIVVGLFGDCAVSCTKGPSC
jgi:hypothetical protein